MKAHNPRIVCADGFSISVQVGDTMYCTPRMDYPDFPHTHVECGFPSSIPITAELRGYAENGGSCYENEECDFTDTVYACVPVETVMAELEKHGEIVEGKMP